MNTAAQSASIDRSSDWSGQTPYSADHLASLLWSVSHYFDADTRRFFGCRVNGAYVWTHRETRTPLMVVRESVQPPHGPREHRIVIILGRKGDEIRRISCANAKAATKRYHEILSGMFAAVRTETLDGIGEHVRSLGEE